MIYLYVGVCFVLPWTFESFPFMFWRWRITNLNYVAWSYLLPPHYFVLGSSILGHCEQKNNARWGGYLCRWSSTSELEMNKTPRMVPVP